MTTASTRILPWLLTAIVVGLLPAVASAQGHTCSYCHQLHGAGGSVLKKQDVQLDLCNLCHNPSAPNPEYPTAPLEGGGSAPANSGFVLHNGAKHSAPTECYDCHGHNGDAGSNIRLIRETMENGRTVLFNSTLGTTAFRTGGPDYQGVCEACHTQTTFHRNSAAGDHAHNVAPVYTVCNTCHTHNTGFKGSGSCLTCHATGGAGTQGPNSRRAIIPEFGRASHHTDIAASGSTADTARWEADCQVCHDQSQAHTHQDGTVVLKNADTPSTTYALAGDAQTNATEAAKLIPFCMSCHEDGSAGGDTSPFSDNVAIPVVGITSSFFTVSASHGPSKQLSCFGAGAVGCHATAHGSQKANLLGLSPGTSPVSGADPLYFQEEGFCFNCHKRASEGGVAPDIASQFGMTINWTKAPSGLNSSTTLNDRHDVQHLAQQGDGGANPGSGAKIECVNCHDPHTASSSAPLRADPDPNDGFVPGSGPARIPGIDQRTAWCLECHDDTYPPGVTAPTTALTIIQSTYDGLNTWAGARQRGYSDDNHGVGAASNTNLDTDENPVPHGGASDWAQGDLLPCQACHKPHPDSLGGLPPTQVLNNLFQLKNRVTAKNMTTLIPVDPANGGAATHYEVTDNNGGGAARNFSGYYFCNTCHFNNMENNSNCFRCHFHGDGRF